MGIQDLFKEVGKRYLDPGYKNKTIMKEKSQTSEEDNKDKSIILAKTVIKKKKGKKC